MPQSPSFSCWLVPDDPFRTRWMIPLLSDLLPPLALDSGVGRAAAGCRAPRRTAPGAQGLAGSTDSNAMR